MLYKDKFLYYKNISKKTLVGSLNFKIACCSFKYQSKGQESSFDIDIKGAK